MTEPTAAERVLVLGETLVDIVRAPGREPVEHPGGSPANVALTLGRLGRDVTLATQLADDPRGRSARSWLEASGVGVAAEAPGSGHTSTATAVLDSGGAATYEFDLTWDLSAATVAQGRPESAAVVHTGSISTVLHPGADVVLAAVRAASHRSLISFDPNARPAITPDVEAVLPIVEQLVALSDVVKVSDEDLAWYFPGRTPAEVARRWADAGPVLVVVTLGGEGCLLVHAGSVLTIPGVPVTVADTIGAGDTFSGALIDALLTEGVAGRAGRDVLAALPADRVVAAATWAAAAAAVTVSRPGADPPTRAELPEVEEVAQRPSRDPWP